MPEDTNLWITAIGSVGFPIVAYGFVVMRLEKTMIEIKDTLGKVAVSLATCPIKSEEVR